LHGLWRLQTCKILFLSARCGYEGVHFRFQKGIQAVLCS
jgi:hypothetical protein